MQNTYSIRGRRISDCVEELKVVGYVKATRLVMAGQAVKVVIDLKDAKDPRVRAAKKQQLNALLMGLDVSNMTFPNY